jgi:hypothetical protein
LTREELEVGQAKMKKKDKPKKKSRPASPGRPDGRRFSPVIRANTKFYGDRAICVDVRFKDVRQLDALIAALMELRAFPSDGFDHVHLQDDVRHNLASAEVTFYHPSVKRGYADKLCVKSARKLFESLTVG